jgi:hypothetical protein
MSEPSDDYRPRCRNLCCKSMMVFGENFESDPDYVPGVTDFWCVLTSKGHGPDGEHVALDACSDPKRGCFQEY